MWSEPLQRQPSPCPSRTPRRARPTSVGSFRRALPLLLAAVALGKGAVAAQQADTVDGFRTVASPDGVETTLARVKAEVEGRGLSVFSEIDHTANARSVDQELPPTRLLLFGNPDPGTRLMRCQRTVAVDLPMKVLVWEGEDGRTRIGWNDPHWLARRHGIETDSPECGVVVARMSEVLAAIAAAAAEPGPG